VCAAIKTGRYTHAKKAKYITEVKMLLAQKQQEKTSTNCSDYALENQHDVSSLISQENSHSDLSINTTNIATELSSMRDASSANEDVNIHSYSVAACEAQPVNDVINIHNTVAASEAQPMDDVMNIHNSFAAGEAQPMDDVMHIDIFSQSSPLAVSDMNKIIEHITNVHLSQTPLTPDFIASLPDRERRYFVSIYNNL